MSSSREEIFDALTGDERGGCDSDWCAQVLEEANPRDLVIIRLALGKSDSTLDGEVETELVRQGVLKPRSGLMVLSLSEREPNTPEWLLRDKDSGDRFDWMNKF
ncbi:MAG: hypothetical protein Q7R43_05060 [Candidatus Daviesbacteria bacterium]|nr:hypothetical protein [Candidatus Daviesbacteria bacterium]